VNFFSISQYARIFSQYPLYSGDIEKNCSISINCKKNQGDIMEIKNPTSQDESGVLFQINHVDPPLRV
jgi:hypothetical protein